MAESSVGDGAPLLTPLGPSSGRLPDDRSFSILYARSWDDKKVMSSGSGV